MALMGILPAELQEDIQRLEHKATRASAELYHEYCTIQQRFSAHAPGACVDHYLSQPALNSIKSSLGLYDRGKQYLLSLEQGPWRLTVTRIHEEFGPDALTSERFLKGLRALQSLEPDWATANESLRAKHTERTSRATVMKGVSRSKTWAPWEVDKCVALYKGMRAGSGGDSIQVLTDQSRQNAASRAVLTAPSALDSEKENIPLPSLPEPHSHNLQPTGGAEALRTPSLSLKIGHSNTNKKRQSDSTTTPVVVQRNVTCSRKKRRRLSEFSNWAPSPKKRYQSVAPEEARRETPRSPLASTTGRDHHIIDSLQDDDSFLPDPGDDSIEIEFGRCANEVLAMSQFPSASIMLTSADGRSDGNDEPSVDELQTSSPPDTSMQQEHDGEPAANLADALQPADEIRAKESGHVKRVIDLTSDMGLLRSVELGETKEDDIARLEATRDKGPTLSKFFAPGRWLNDEAIYATLQALNPRSMHFCVAHPAAMNTPKDVGLSRSRGCRILSTPHQDGIVIPVHWADDHHWTLAIFRIAEQEILHYDSLQDHRRQEMAETRLQAFMRSLSPALATKTFRFLQEVFHFRTLYVHVR